MDSRFIEKALRIAKKTGNTVIIAPEDGASGMVVVPFETYERLVESSGESLTDEPKKVIMNREVQQNPDPSFHTNSESKLFPGESENVAEEDRYYMEPLD